MKHIIIIILLILCSGCSEKTKNTINQMLTEENGWGISGYTKKDDNIKLKIGDISSDIIYENSKPDIPYSDQNEEELIKQEGFILGVFFKKRF